MKLHHFIQKKISRLMDYNGFYLLPITLFQLKNKRIIYFNTFKFTSYCINNDTHVNQIKIQSTLFIILKTLIKDYFLSTKNFIINISNNYP